MSTAAPMHDRAAAVIARMAIVAPMWLPVLELILGVAALGLAGMVLRADAGTPANRFLALVLAVDGIGWFGLASAGLSIYPASAFEVVLRMSLAASPWLYIVFVAHALEHAPMMRLWQHRRVQWALLALAVVVPLFLLFFGEAAFYRPIRRYVGLITGPHLFFATFALVAGIQEFRRSPERRRALVYLCAFTVRDLALVILFSGALVQKQLPDVAVVAGLLATVKALLLLHIALLAYGLLSGQVLGMDDRVRVGLQKTFVTALVAVVFLAMTEGIESLLNIDSLALGIAAAGAVTFLFGPMHSLAARISSALVPGTALTGEYKDRRAVYEQQARVAWQDGNVTEKEREMLDRLAAHLGIPATDQEVVEKSARHGEG